MTKNQICITIVFVLECFLLKFLAIRLNLKVKKLKFKAQKS